jgi:hypothetical protein
MIASASSQPDPSQPSSGAEGVHHYVRTIRSDDLAHLRNLASVLPAAAPLLRVAPTMTVVVDASIVIGEVLHLARWRGETEIRTSLEEVIAAHAVVAIAPTWLEEEMRLKLPIVAAREDVPIDRLLAAWRRLRPQLRLVATWDMASGPSGSVDLDAPVIDGYDPKDAPYVAIFDQYGADAVLTADRHISAMGAQAAPRQLIFDLRTYTRAESVRVTFHANALIIGVSGSAAIDEVFKAIRAIVDWIRKLPPAVHLTAAGILLVMLATEKGREMLGKAFEATGEGAAALVRSVRAALLHEVTRALVKALADATAEAGAAARKLSAAIPKRPRNRTTLRYAARRALAAAGEPITLSDLEVDVKRAGYTSSSPTFRQYLRRVISEDPLVAPLADGRWALRSI